jgi:hypothetical protein
MPDTCVEVGIKKGSRSFHMLQTVNDPLLRRQVCQIWQDVVCA